MEFHISSTTCNNNKNVFIPLSSVSHIIENTAIHENESQSTTWIHFHNGKSIHIETEYEDVKDDILRYISYIR